MNAQSIGDEDSFQSQPWYRKLAMVVLSPLVIPVIPLVLLIIGILGLCAATANYVGEWQVRFRMRRCGRYLSLSEAQSAIARSAGTLIIEQPSLGWNVTRAWWTPENLVAQSPFGLPCHEDYKNAAKTMTALDWDRWCWRNYTSLDNGRAFFIRGWNGASIERALKKRFPDLKVVRTWTALVDPGEPPQGPATNAT